MKRPERSVRENAVELALDTDVVGGPACDQLRRLSVEERVRLDATSILDAGRVTSRRRLPLMDLIPNSLDDPERFEALVGSGETICASADAERQQQAAVEGQERWRSSMSHSIPAYVAELYGAKADLPEILDSLAFNADSPAAAKRRARNWVAQAAGVADSAWIRLRHCNTTVLDKQVAELLRPELDVADARGSAEQQAPQSTGSEAHMPKLLEPMLASLHLARSALTGR
jgi:hypothetical protein